MIRSIGIETSCDECSASIVELHLQDDTSRPVVRSLCTYSQIKEHRPFGGVVPEVASRNHLLQVQPVIEQALKDANYSYNDIDVISVTNRPGLIGALLVGVTAAKGLAYALKKPLAAVHHLHGHLVSPFLLDGDRKNNDVTYPAIFLMVSGGHTQIHVIHEPPHLWGASLLKDSLVGHSQDDAAGEAFDKTAKMLGYPYPGGKYLDEAAKGGNINAYKFPRGLPQKDNLNFSFSGLKTAVSLEIKKSFQESNRSDFAASVQNAIVDSLISKTLRAVDLHKAKSIVVVGGVSANSHLRSRFSVESSVPVLFPDLKYSTDQAAMIAAAGAFMHAQGRSTMDYLHLNGHAVAEI